MTHWFTGYAKRSAFAFTLVEVVLALGVIAIAIVAILGIVPIGLSTGKNAQDETRAAQLAQTILSSMASQSQTQSHFNNVLVQLADGSSTSFNLAQSESKTIYGDNEGKLIAAATAAAYAVDIVTNGAPAGFDTGYANLVTVSVGWPANATVANRTKRNFIRIVSRY